MVYKSYFLILNLTLFYTILKCNAIELDNCTTAKDNLAKAISDFTLCSINYSRPITLCKDCIDMYIDILKSYKNMSEMSYNGTMCLHYYINLDRLQILETQFINSIELWNRAKCYECYLVKNEIQTHNESDVSKTFHTYYDKFNACTKKANEQMLCSQCMDDYVTLSNFYSSISNTNEKIGICIDLEDMMNRTWTYWGTHCCKYRKHREYVFIGSTIAVLFITIMLYIVVQFCGEKKAPTIIQQSRFAESMNRL